MSFPTKLNQLCTPSYVYFIVSILLVAISAVQNFGNKNKYTMGMFSCSVPSCIAIFMIKILYIFFWTWVLNLMCKDGHKGIAWFLVLLPLIVMVLIFAGVMAYQRRRNQKESMCNCKK